MTVSNVSRRVAYTGNAITSVFAVPFQYFELEVYLDGVLQTVGVDYTSDQLGPGLTGTVTFLVAPAGGQSIVIVGATVKVQETDLVDNDSAPAESYERALDRLTMISQELELLSAQSIRSPVFGSAQPALNFDASPGAFVAVNEVGQLYLPPLLGPSSPLVIAVQEATDTAVALSTAAALASANTATTQAGIATTQVGLAAAQVVLATAQVGLATTQASNAAASASSALTAYDQFDDRYLGPKSADPTLDNDGNALITGALYFNTTTNTMRVRTAVPSWIEAASSNNQRTDAIVFMIGGGAGVITTGIKGDLTIPFDCTILSWTLLADQVGSIVLDLWKGTYGNYPPVVGDTITAAAKPTLAGVNKNTNAVLTGWNKTIVAGDTFRINVDSAATITRATLTLAVQKG